MTDTEDKPPINPVEALLGFMAWLNTMEKGVVFGQNTDPEVSARLVHDFAKANNLDWITKNYPDNITHPGHNRVRVRNINQLSSLP